MQDLRLIGVHEDGQHLLLADLEGTRFRVPLDESLRAAARRDRPRLGQLQIEMADSMRPREVQALIRAGASAEEVAERSGWPVEKVHRYEGPILAEREHVAGLARSVRLRGRGSSQGSAPTLAARVGQRLSGRGVDAGVAEWDSARDDEGAWTVILTFPAGGRQRQARWHFDVAARTVTAADDEARWLSEDDSSGANTPLPAPHLVAAPVRATTVYDVEAEGGVAASARRKPSTTAEVERPSREEPVDLMTAMRERASARGRRGGRRKSAPTQTPVDVAPREDALPLEDIAYDPETMPPPPAARGPHPADAGAEGVGDDVLPAAEPPAAEPPALDPPVTEVPAAEAPAADDDRASDRHDSDTHDSDDRDDAGHDPHESAPVAGFEDAAEAETSPSTSAPADEGADRDTPDAATADAAGEEPLEQESAPSRPARRNGRPSVPSWDDVMFGAKPRS